MGPFGWDWKIVPASLLQIALVSDWWCTALQKPTANIKSIEYRQHTIAAASEKMTLTKKDEEML